jgi:dynactin complex subunit
MLKPTNAKAEFVDRLINENKMLKQNIDTFNKQLERNSALIEELKPEATWEELSPLDNTTTINVTPEDLAALGIDINNVIS